MKLISWLITAALIFLAICFALANRQPVAANLWPFGIVIKAPLFLFSLGTLLLGLFAGAFIGWVSSLPHRTRAARLRKDIGALREKIDALQTTAAPLRRREDRALLPRPKKWSLWGKQS